MNESEILEFLQEIADVVFFSPVAIQRSLSAVDVEEWDSVANVTFVMSVEQKFGLRFKTGQFEKFQNIGDLVDFILKAKSI